MKRFIQNILLLLIIIYLIPTANNYCQLSSQPKYWEYRWGDSPIDSSGKLLWLKEANMDNSWKAISKPSQIPIAAQKKDLWVRINLKDIGNECSAIFIKRIEKIFEVYLDTTIIYSFGKFSSGEKIPVMGFAWHLIKLPKNLNGKTLYFRIRSDTEYIGVYSEIKFGTEGYFLSEIVKENLSKTILGVIFTFAGMALFVFLLITGKVKPFLGIIIFMTSNGIWTLANSSLTQILFYMPKVIYYTDHLALFASAIGFFMVVVEIIDYKYKKIFTQIYRLLILYLVVVSILDITGITDNLDTVAPFLALVIIAVFALIYFIFLSARKGNGEAKILLAALAVYSTFALLDIVNYFQNVVINPDTYEMQFAHYGGFAFLLFTAWIFVFRYIEMNKKMIKAQVNERVRIARDLHDEVGPRLTEIKMVGESFNSRDNLTEDEKAKINELTYATDKVVSTFGEIVWALNPTNDTLEEFGSYLSQRGINFLQKANIKCRIDMPPVLPQKKISYEVRRNILMAISEILNNIVKHADASLVTIAFNYIGNKLEIVIEDDGHGFDIHNTRKYGNGLKNIESRIKSIGGSYSINTMIDTGTVIKMEIPLGLN